MRRLRQLVQVWRARQDTESVSIEYLGGGYWALLARGSGKDVKPFDFLRVHHPCTGRRVLMVVTWVDSVAGWTAEQADQWARRSRVTRPEPPANPQS